MARHTGTCQHVCHPKDRERRESKNSKGPVKTGANRAPGFIELENTKVTAEENAAVRACLNCAVPKGRRMSADEAKHWPKAGPSQMQDAFNRAFAAYSRRNGMKSSAEARRFWAWRSTGARKLDRQVA